MAKPASFSKKDLEKKKAEKRKEKQLKKEKRKESGSDSFEDMIAYVDQNGMITDTPPDLNVKSNVKVENITISTPKKEDIEEEPMLQGRVEHFNESKGFGFIKAMNSTEKYFFHISNTSEPIQEGDVVQFELERGKRGMNATNITLFKQ